MDYSPIVNSVLAEIHSTFHADPSLDLYGVTGPGPHSDWGTMQIWSPPVIDNLTLAAFAHEAGHIATAQAMGDYAYKAMDQIMREWLATQWGMTAIRRHGAKLTPAIETFLAEALWGYVTNLPYDVAHFVQTSEYPKARNFLQSNLKE